MPTVTIYTWYGTDRVYLNKKGKIDAKSRNVFLSGQCHALALALKELKPEWELYGLVEPKNTPYDPGHVVIKSNTGDFIDIDGPGADIRYKEKYKDVEIYPITVNQAKNRFETFLKPAIKAALPFAKTILESYENKISN